MAKGLLFIWLCLACLLLDGIKVSLADKDVEESGKDAAPSSQLEFLSSCGGWVSPALQVQKFGDAGSGLVTKESIPHSTLLISVPFNCSLCEGTVLAEEPSLQQLQKYIKDNSTAKSLVSSKVPIITFVMLQMRKSKGRFASLTQYLHSQLPSLKRLPHFWPASEQSELKGVDIMKGRMMVDEYSVITDAIPELGNTFPLSAYIAAASLVSARAFEDRYHSSMILPGVGLINHHLPMPSGLLPSEELHAYQEQNENAKLLRDYGAQTFELRANRKLRKGEQLHRSYGIFRNSLYLAKYGFVVPWVHNLTCLTYVQLHMQVDKLAGGQLASLWKEKVLHDRLVVSFRIDSCLKSEFEDALTFARMLSTRAKLKDLEADCGLKPSAATSLLVQWRLNLSCPHVSRVEEQAALRQMKSAAVVRRSEMAGGTLDDEEALLQNSSLPWSIKSAAHVRRDQKYVLLQLENFLSLAEGFLSRAGSNWRSYLNASHDVSGMKTDTTSSFIEKTDL
eukprot:TRINITY_DN40662_c0_g1_i1.p1 TRINITY_DN40662_c0_g1~~TRINITY_DN40662_c0_g1_i1.p1  ORF type:complete len:507 (+),score=88.88 TRINITY_DN40662_c0_g1_i1:191-1711(+)